MDYRNMSYADIVDWCDANNELDWLETQAAKKQRVEVYPFVTVINADGTKSRKYDKTQTPKIENRPISFLLLKEAFVDKFMPEIKPVAKAKKPSMLEIVRARKAAKK